MFKNLDANALGVSGRQSELIELALTYGYRGMTFDVAELSKRAASHGREVALRFISSAKIRIGQFELPINWQHDDAAFKADLLTLDAAAELAASAGATACTTYALPASDDKNYHENFEFHQNRFSEIAEILKKYDIKLGIGFHAAPEHRQGKSSEFIFQAEPMLTLIKTINSDTVGLALNTWDWHVGGGALDQLSELSGDKVVTVTLCDLPSGEEASTANDEERILPGSENGQIDCVPILRQLGEAGFSGPVTVQCGPRSGITRDAIVQRVSNLMNDLFRAAGINKAGKFDPTLSAETEAAQEAEEAEAEAASS